MTHLHRLDVNTAVDARVRLQPSTWDSASAHLELSCDLGDESLDSQRHKAPCLLLVLLSLAASAAGCQRPASGTGGNTPGDAGITGGHVDAGLVGDPGLVTECPAATPDGGLISLGAISASVSPAQNSRWVALSTDAECQLLAPGPISPQLSWTPPEKCGTDANGNPVCYRYCDAATVDGDGDLSVSWYPSLWFIQPDGSGTGLTAGVEHLRWFTPERGAGFLLTTNYFPPTRPDLTPLTCSYVRRIGATGSASPPVPFEVTDHIIANPVGGYVAARKVGSKDKLLLQVRWMDDLMQPLGDWHTAVSWTALEHDWELLVDQRGSALILSFLYPPSFGAPSPPAEWTFGARWMGPDGPLSDSFVPIAPVYTPFQAGLPVLFATWGAILPLREGGFASYQAQVPTTSGGSISPTGWYALYPSSEARTTPVADWLQSQSGSMQLLAGGNGYAAVRRDPKTCARTIELIAASGRRCFMLPVDGSAVCDTATDGKSTDAIFPDGTFVLQRGCEHRWWPRIAQPAR